MLPFEKQPATKRWQCFVCGKEFLEYEPFKQHIIESHDEGREYIICPLQRCMAPIRDLKIHFKVKHPHDKIPKGQQMRPIIWKDHGKKGKLKTKKPGFRNGDFVSIKNGKDIHYRSGYECEVYECLEIIPEVVAFDGEPIKNGIQYFFKGETHHYYPDISIKFADGHIEIWEIKPATQTSLPVNEAKWAAANEYCNARGWEFIVITEVGIGKLKKKARVI